MEKELNIAEILKDKPKGTKLYSSACGKCELKEADDKSFKISFYSSKSGFMNGGEGTFDKNGNLYDDGECIVFPSKEMRDWSKFAWKKGDVLVSNNSKTEVIFKGWKNDSYTLFNGAYALTTHNDGEIEYIGDSLILKTCDYKGIEVENAAQGYINIIEERFGGKFNRETLEIEKPQPEFKDGDIITIMPHIGDKLIYLFKTEDDEKYYGHAYLDGNIAIINEDSYCQKDFNTARPSTEKEKQQLFEALAKEGKRWNAEKKVIEDIKKEYQFKPFEKVLARDSKYSLWHIDLYEGMLKDGNEYNYRCMAADWVYCIPYEGNEQLLGTTKDVEEDYE